MKAINSIWLDGYHVFQYIMDDFLIFERTWFAVDDAGCTGTGNSPMSAVLMCDVNALSEDQEMMESGA